MKIFAAGLITETNTFSPIPTSLEDFTVLRGKDAADGRIDHPNLDLSLVWGTRAKEIGAEFTFSLMAFAQPAGFTVRSAYESLRQEILSDLQAALPVDVVLLMLHGAMLTEEYGDCEEDLIRCVRDLVGPNAIIGVELDLHCHLSESKIAAADLVITYKEYPHVDINDRAQELFELAVKTHVGKVRPTMGLFDCRMIGAYPTTQEPMRSFVASMKAAERRFGVLSVSFGHGFQLADIPRAGATMLVVTNDDQALAWQVARDLGMQIYELRQEIGFRSLSLDEALRKAVSSDKTPVVVADQSDNPGGGAPGDATYALRWLLDNQAESVAMGIFYDPEVVKIARKAGVGARLPVRLGGKMGRASGDPIDIEVTVQSSSDHYVHIFPQLAGESVRYPVGDIVALRHGSIDIVVGSRRCQCVAPSVFSDLGIDPKRKRILIPKSTQHFYAAFSQIAGETIYMSGPGAVALDPRQIPYRRLHTDHLYPWIEDPLGTVQ